MVALLTLAVIVSTDDVSDRAWQDAMAEANRIKESGQYRDAEAAYRRAVQESEKLPQPSVRTGVSLNDLALVCAIEGKYREAETLYLRAIQIFEQTAKPTDSNLPFAFSNLAGVY